MMEAALTVAGWIDLGGCVVLAGGLVYQALVGAPSEAGARALRAALAALVLALGVEFGLTALRMKDVSGIGGTRLVADLLEARWGRLWALRCLALPLLASRTRVAVLLAAPWLLLRSLQGHAGAHGTGAAVIDWLHLVAAAVWIGGLVQVALLPRPLPVEVARRMRGIATAAIAVLIPAGVYAALLHVERWEMLFGSAYGRVLVAKVVLAAVLVTLGAVNHFRHFPAMARGEPEAPGRLTAAVRFELAVAAAVLLLTALLGELPMPHAHGG